MKQIIDRIIPNRKAAMYAAGAAVLFLCVFAAISFTAAAFGRGFRSEESRSAGTDQQSVLSQTAADESAQILADALAEQKFMEVELEQRDAHILTLEEENQTLRDALAQAQEENKALVRQLEESEADREQVRTTLDLVLSDHSKKYLVKVTVTGEYVGGIIKLSWPDYFYATAEEFAQYQRGDILTGHPEVGHPSTGDWTVVIEDKLSIELEGVD